MTYSAEVLRKSLESLDIERAQRIIGLAGGLRKAVGTIRICCRAFGVPQNCLAEVMPLLCEASKRFHNVPKCRALSY